MAHTYHGNYTGEHIQHIAYPLGGIGTGMLCLEGTGALSHVSLYHRPTMYYEPLMFAALSLGPGQAQQGIVLEGQVPPTKVFRVPGGGSGLYGKSYGLPRFESCSFESRFPFASVMLEDNQVPVSVGITAWSPFIPGDSGNSSLPCAALEYAFTNLTRDSLEMQFSFHVSKEAILPAQDHTAPHRVSSRGKGFCLARLAGDPLREAAWLAVASDDENAQADCRWFRGGWFDTLTTLWNKVARGGFSPAGPWQEGPPSPGASLFVPCRLQPGETRTIRVMTSWYVPDSQLDTLTPDQELSPGKTGQAGRYYRPWYAARFDGIAQVADHFISHYSALKDKTRRFTDCLYASTLPGEVMEAVTANLSILKSPTLLVDEGGRLWGWEGCNDQEGCCAGSCTHVWNYAQAIPHLFPDLERSLRETEFLVSQDSTGHQNFRAALPLRDYRHSFHAAADGQLGGILKVWRDFLISGDRQWLNSLWPRVRQSLDYCISAWDPERAGVLSEPHHNTYDIEFWGPDGMCTSIYLGALQAAVHIARVLDDDERADAYGSLYQRGRAYMEQRLFNGEYFVQEVRSASRTSMATRGLEMTGVQSPEAHSLFLQEGPKYQYGEGCLSDGILGAWLSRVCKLDTPLVQPGMVASHLRSVFRYNFRRSLQRHANPQRPGFALGEEAGLVLCSWPRGGKPSLPFVYSDEVWPGIEYQVASHLAMIGCVDEALAIVRAVRDRFDGTVRNPYNEYECGHWYARSLASYALLQAFSGASYDAYRQRMTLSPAIPGDFACFIAVRSGYGLAGVRGGEPFLEVAAGQIPVKEWQYSPWAAPEPGRAQGGGE